MANNTNSGFTIIETMLFLAVSALLIATIMVGVGGVVNQQRYRDSLNSLRSYIQNQYSNVTNTINDRDKQSCTNAVIAAGDKPRGTTDCVILGRYIVGSSDGTTLTSANVIASPKTPTAIVSGDIEYLQENYTIAASTIGADTYPVAWSSRIIKEDDATAPKPFSMLIVRAPLSGAVMTFTSSSVVAPSALVTVANNKASLALCVDGDATLGSNQRLGVRIEGYAANANSVQVVAQNERLCR